MRPEESWGQEDLGVIKEGWCCHSLEVVNGSPPGETSVALVVSTVRGGVT